MCVLDESPPSLDSRVLEDVGECGLCSAADWVLGGHPWDGCLGEEVPGCHSPMDYGCGGTGQVKVGDQDTVASL